MNNIFFTTNQPTVLSVMAYQPSKQGTSQCMGMIEANGIQKTLKCSTKRKNQANARLKQTV